MESLWRGCKGVKLYLIRNQTSEPYTIYLHEGLSWNQSFSINYLRCYAKSWSSSLFCPFPQFIGPCSSSILGPPYFRLVDFRGVKEYKARAKKKATQLTHVEFHTSYKIIRQANIPYLLKFYRSHAGLDHACLKGLSHYFEGIQASVLNDVSGLLWVDGVLYKCKVLNARGTNKVLNGDWVSIRLSFNKCKVLNARDARKVLNGDWASG